MKAMAKDTVSLRNVPLLLFCVFVLTGEASVRMTAGKAQGVTPHDPVLQTLRFEPNQGQADEDVMFLARGRGVSLALKSTEVVLKPSRTVTSADRRRPATGAITSGTLRPSPFTMRLINANSRPRAAGAEKLQGHVNSVVGADASRWRTNIPTYAKVKYEDVYPGVDLVYYGNSGQLEYDFVVAPHRDPSVITLEFPDAEELAIEQHDLVLQAAGETLRMHKPLVYQVVEGGQKVVAGGYVLRGARRVGFQLAAYDATRPLVIDPVLEYSTYMGGLGGDSGQSIAAIGGAIYVTGESNGQAFVAKLDPSLSGGAALVYFTVFGGSATAAGNALAVGPDGSVWVTGSTSSSDFPALDPAQGTYGGGPRDAFVTKLNSTGWPVFSTYIGGSGDDVGLAISLRCVSGTALVCASAAVTGFTTSVDFPTQNALQSSYGGGASDAFVTTVGPNSLGPSTYLGGSGEDVGSGIVAVGVILGSGGGETYVTGFTTSTDFPTAAPLQAAHGGGVHDAFVAQLNPMGSALIFSTYLGGSGSDRASGLSAFADGLCMTGTTTSSNFPTVNPLQATHAGGASDAFVSCVSPSGSALVYSTYLGGAGEDIGAGITGAADDLYVTGSTDSGGSFPKNKKRLPVGGGVDAFVTRLHPAASRGAALVFSTPLGGSGDDEGLGIAVDGFGFVYVTGQTSSSDFPTTPGALQTMPGGAPSDAFVVKIVP